MQIFNVTCSNLILSKRRAKQNMRKRSKIIDPFILWHFDKIFCTIDYKDLYLVICKIPRIQIIVVHAV